MKKQYLDLVQFAIEKAKKAGADEAEAFISDSNSIRIDVSQREIEGLNAANNLGIGFRLLKEGKMISGSSNDLSKSAVLDLLDDLMRKVVFHTVDEFNTLPGRANSNLLADWTANSDLLAYDPQMAEISIQEKIKRALKLEAAGLDYSSKIAGSMMTVYSDDSTHYYLANTKGISGWFPASGCGGFAYYSAAEGDDHQSGSHSHSSVKYTGFDPEKVGCQAAENAIEMLGAKPIESCEIPMVIAPEVSTQIMGYIVNMLSADVVQKGKSLFAEKLETSVASSIFNLIDDGVLKGGIETSPVDGEGIPRQTTPLIVDGILKNYLYDSYTAKKDGIKSTGNRSRGSFQSPGMIGSTNLFMKPGDSDVESIFAGIKKGFYLKDAIGLHAGIDSTSGDFSIPAAGFMIADGVKSYPVRGISIGGNLFELLSTIDQIADNLTWNNNIACPTFSVSNILIGGSS